MRFIATCFALFTPVCSAAELHLIPKPVSLTSREGSFTLKPNPAIAAPASLANEARYLADTLAPATGWKTTVTTGSGGAITLNLNTNLTDLGDEGYTLCVAPQGIRIEAHKPAGVFYGIQTLRQLLPAEIDSPQAAEGVTWSVPCVEIRDVPRFAWRGFMLDSCRHFQSVVTVKLVLDSMARHKLNRLHWHLTEDEAWRIEVPGRPELTDKGAWRAGLDDHGKPTQRYGGSYSAKDVREILAHARQRHILVYPEIEMPGHGTAAIHACPQYGCDGKPVIPGHHGDLGISSFQANGRRAFCPSRPETYRFLEDVSLKVSTLFETPYIHIGADEVPREQWDKCPRCQEFIKKENLKDNVGLQQFFGKRMAASLRKQGKKPIYWGVDLERGIPEGMIVQGWHPGESALAAKKGFQTINSDCTGTYLDFPAGPGDTGDGSRWLGRLPIEKVYQFEPVPAGLTPEQAKLVIGSEAALWTEYVPEHKVMSKVFPRLFAFSEVVWSAQQPRDFAEFEKRMSPHLERLELREIPYYGRQQGGRPLGAWSPGILKPGDTTLEFDATAAMRKRPGVYQASFRFSGGQHALEIRSVSLLRDGVEISNDPHAGLAGGRHENETYSLTVPDAKPGGLTVRAVVAGMGGTDSNGELLLSTDAAPARVENTDFKSQSFRVDPNYLARHDVVYHSPMQLEAEGFPLGNGDMGGLIWNHENGIELQINKNDVWSGPEDGKGAGTLCVPRHCARVKVDFGMPVFSWIHHINDFEGRFSLQKGEASFNAKTGFSEVTIRSWLPQDRNVWVIECGNQWNGKHVENASSLAKVSIERLGSRAFGGWYAGGFSRNPGSGLGNTRTSIGGNDMLIEETADGMHFVVACRILGADKAPLRLNNHLAETHTGNPKFTVLISVATKDDAKDPRAAAVALLDKAQQHTIEKLRAEKDQWFASFWAKSFVKLGDDYLENIYYLRRYLMGIGSRGKYPVVFNGGLWRWNRDVINWITPHHWNTQQQYWGLCVQNDSALMRPYLETYDRMSLQPGMAQLAARRGAPNDAILLAEMHQFDGTMVDPDRGDMKNAHTQAAQAASRFWETYEFTCDKGFLRSTAYPFMRKAANFYLQKLRWDEAKKAFTMSGSNYEDGGGHGAVPNPLADRACIEQLFRSCIQAAAVLKTDADLSARWQHVLDHLWKIRVVTEKDITGEVIATSDDPVKYSVKQWALGGVVAFPGGLIGIDQKDTPVGKAVMNYIRSLNGTMYSHHPTPVIAARMGDGDEALKLLKDGIGEMQYFPSGLFFNCRGYPSKIYDLDLKVNLIGGPGRPTIKWRDFFQCGMETISLCGTAMNEMMLQSNEGKIRVFPAIPNEWISSPLAFKLLARGGFLVAAERKNRETTQVAIQSQRGQTCHLQNPWPGQTAVVFEAGQTTPRTLRKATGDVIVFDTNTGGEYIICKAGTEPVTAPAVITASPNSAPKKLGPTRMLGIGKGYVQ